MKRAAAAYCVACLAAGCSSGGLRIEGQGGAASEALGPPLFARASNLDGLRELRVCGAHLGPSGAGVGDLDGDGKGDLVLATPGDGSGRSAVVVYGAARPAQLDADRLGRRGFALVGGGPFALGGAQVAPAGDVDGDGRPDLVVAGGRSAYVVFGSRVRPHGSLDLRRLGAVGERIDAPAGEQIVAALGVGDLDGDGRNELAVVTSHGGLVAPTTYTTYVVYGQRRPAGGGAEPPLRLASGHDVLTITGSVGLPTVAAGRDLDGDGRGDLLIGDENASLPGRPEAGVVHVVWGSVLAPGATLDLRRLTDADGYRIVGAEPGDELGRAVAAVGDINGDAHIDVAVAAPGALDARGAVYVVFGSASPHDIDLAKLGAGGFRLAGGRVGAEVGTPIAAPGDVNGDYVADLAVGGGDARYSTQLTAAFVLLGRPANQVAAHLGERAYRIDYAHPIDGIGRVAAAGDVNGDGLRDLLVPETPAAAGGTSPQQTCEVAVFSSRHPPG